VSVRKKVRVRCVLEFDVDVPAHWNAGDVTFWMEDSSHCFDNELVAIMGDEDVNPGPCSCEHLVSAEVIEEAKTHD